MKHTMRYGICALALLGGTAFAQQEKLLASNGSTQEQFGGSAAMSGDTALVGGRAESAYVFTRAGLSWSEQAELEASDAHSGDSFGVALDLSGDRAIVGAMQNDDLGADSGSAYVFVETGGFWSEEAKLLPADGAAADLFGMCVTIDGDTAVVGAPLDDDAGESSGSAYVFVRSGGSWSEQAKLTASDGAAGDRFGWSVALDGDTVVIGAHWDDDGGGESGSAYVFTRSGTVWAEQAKLTAGDAAAGDELGRAVALLGDTALVGASGKDEHGFNSGVAYVFTRSGSVWSQEAKLESSDSAAYDSFGQAVALGDDAALIGAHGDGDAGPGSGSAYLFTRSGSTWSQAAKLVASDAAGRDTFGVAVALDGDFGVVGAPRNDDQGVDSGSAYGFLLFSPGTSTCFGDGSPLACPCSNEAAPGAGTGCLNSTGVGALLTSSGSASVADQGSNPLVLHVAQARPDKNYVFLQGAGTPPQSAFRDGILCVGNPTIRLPGFGCGPVPIGTFDAAGAASTDDAVQGFGVLSADTCKGGSIATDVSGSGSAVRDYQVWFRDGMGPCGTGSNLTNANTVTWIP